MIKTIFNHARIIFAMIHKFEIRKIMIARKESIEREISEGEQEQ
jgi:hypothetical protein